MLKPIEKTNVSDVAFAQIRDMILSGDYSAGEKLPAERKLSDILNVSRGAVRECIKRLEQAGLVETKHGSGAIVQDYRFSASTELLVHLLVQKGEVDKDVARSMMELRTALASDIARRCAEKGVDAAPLHALLNTLEEDTTEDIEVNRQFWETMVDMTGNIAYRLAFNSVNALYEQMDFLITLVVAPELERVDLHRQIADAISAQDADAAAHAARSLVSLGERQINTLLEAL